MYPLLVLKWDARTLTIHEGSKPSVDVSAVECVLTDDALHVWVDLHPRAPRVPSGLEWLSTFVRQHEPYLRIAVVTPAVALASTLYALTGADEVPDPERDVCRWAFRFEPLTIYRLVGEV